VTSTGWASRRKTNSIDASSRIGVNGLIFGKSLHA
jgi:hypothetical protein